MLLLGARSAEAALTSSEKGQIRDFVAAARSENAARVRALVARTDLTAESPISALSEAVAPVPFTDARAVFLRELAFGAPSARRARYSRTLSFDRSPRADQFIRNRRRSRP